MVACVLLGSAALGSGQTVTKVSLSPATVAGGSSSAATVTLSKKAGWNGAVVDLGSSNSAAAVPSSVTIPNGQTKVSFTVMTVPVPANVSATIKASLGTSSSSAKLTVDAPALSSLSVSPSTVAGGNSSIGTVVLGSAAPSAGMEVKLSSSSKGVSVPAEVEIPAGATSAQFSIATKAVTVKAAATISAKLGTKTATGSLTITTFAGTYTGSFYSGSQHGIGPVTFTISSKGTVSGTATDYSSGTASPVALSGTITAAGDATITSVSNNGTNTNTGPFAFNEAGELVGLMTSPSSSNPTAVTANTSGRPLEYAGTYSGSFTDSSGDVTTTTNFKIASSGAITATGSDGGKVTGTVGVTGVATCTIAKPGGTKESDRMYLAFDESGMLNILVINPSDSSGSSVGALTKSYAGAYEFGGGARMVVSDLGVISGGFGTWMLSGTVSATGAVSAVDTDLSSGSTMGVTGTIAAVTGGFTGAGTLSGASSGPWTAAGMPPAAQFLVGCYAVTTFNGPTLSLIVSPDGSITGWGSSATAEFEVTGCVQLNSAIVLVATPTSQDAALQFLILGGTFGMTSTGFVGGGTFTQANQNSGTWSAVPTG